METNEFKVLHFSQEFSLDEIINYLKDKKDILYFTRTLKENKEFHVIKHDDTAFFKLSILESELLKHYEKVNGLSNLVKGVTVKGNDKFAVVENVHPNIINRMKNDLNKLLLK